MDETEQAYHDSFKPRWAADGSMLFGSGARRKSLDDGVWTSKNGAITSQRRDVRVLKATDPGDLVPATLNTQMDSASVSMTTGVPSAQISKETTFSAFINAVDTHTTAGQHEVLVWRLASTLFDDVQASDDNPAKASEWKRRKLALTRFWQDLVAPIAASQLAESKSMERKALINLSANNLWDACGDLVEGRDHKLSTIASQLPGDEHFRGTLNRQLDAWSKQGALAEFSKEIRALYEVCAGNVCISEPRAHPPGLENKVHRFGISEEANFDWKQAFGLRLWYGILKDEGVEEAVRMLEDDLRSGRETVKPKPWYQGQKDKNVTWKDDRADHREDLIWGLLRVYRAYAEKPGNAGPQDLDLAEILAPLNARPNPLDTRLSWQLAQLLQARGIAYFKDAKTADSLTLDYATALINAGHLTQAIFVLLHLSTPVQREAVIKELLATHASWISVPDTPFAQTHEYPTFQIITEKLQIPAGWIYAAKALYARAVENSPVKEVRYLLAARDFGAAHEVFCRAVAPRAIFEHDYETVRQLLHGFNSPDESGKPGFESVREWNVGGRVFENYLSLLTAKDAQEKKRLVESLVEGLGQMMVDKGKTVGFERVALAEMAERVAEIVGEGEGKLKQRARMLRLPLGQGKLLGVGLELAREYYGAVMAGGR